MGPGGHLGVVTPCGRSPRPCGAADEGWKGNSAAGAAPGPQEDEGPEGSRKGGSHAGGGGSLRCSLRGEGTGPWRQPRQAEHDLSPVLGPALFSVIEIKRFSPTDSLPAAGWSQAPLREPALRVEEVERSQEGPRRGDCMCCAEGRPWQRAGAGGPGPGPVGGRHGGGPAVVIPTWRSTGVRGSGGRLECGPSLTRKPQARTLKAAHLTPKFTSFCC